MRYSAVASRFRPPFASARATSNLANAVWAGQTGRGESLPVGADRLVKLLGDELFPLAEPDRLGESGLLERRGEGLSASRPVPRQHNPAALDRRDEREGSMLIAGASFRGARTRAGTQHIQLDSFEA